MTEPFIFTLALIGTLNKLFYDSVCTQWNKNTFREKYNRFYKEVIIMQNEELFYDTNEAIKFISERTGIDPNVVAKVLDADVEFMRKIGIIEDEEG